MEPANAHGNRYMIIYLTWDRQIGPLGTPWSPADERWTKYMIMWADCLVWMWTNWLVSMWAGHMVWMWADCLDWLWAD